MRSKCTLGRRRSSNDVCTGPTAAKWCRGSPGPSPRGLAGRLLPGVQYVGGLGRSARSPHRGTKVAMYRSYEQS